jgi:hypothetical protein
MIKNAANPFHVEYEIDISAAFQSFTRRCIPWGKKSKPFSINLEVKDMTCGEDP